MQNKRPLVLLSLSGIALAVSSSLYAAPEAVNLTSQNGISVASLNAASPLPKRYIVKFRNAAAAQSNLQQFDTQSDSTATGRQT